MVSGPVLPIDIHINKLLDWLIDRRHCPRDWTKSVGPIQEKISHAVEDMPEVEEIYKMIRGSHLHYFHCLRIVELLKDTEAETKNIFGGYGSRRMKDWQEIVKLYEKDNVGLAAASHLLMRLVQFEIPNTKKQISRCQQTQEESYRKESDYISSEKHAREGYKSLCQHIGIKGDCVEVELSQLIFSLPKLLTDITSHLPELDGAVQYYKDFITFTGSTACDEVLKMLLYLRERGNMTVYEWRVGLAPKVVEGRDHMSITRLYTSHAEGGDEIDFGDVPETADDVGIDFDVIDFGDVALQGEEIVVADENVLSEEKTKENLDDGVARGEDALTLLECTRTRNLFIDDLVELATFLEGREVEEGDSEGELISTSLLQGAPGGPCEGRREGQEKVKGMLASLTTTSMQHLYMIQASSKYIDRLASTLHQQWLGVEKGRANQGAVVEQREEARVEQVEKEREMDELVERGRDIQSKIEQDISRKYKDRPVNIMGSIKNVL